MSSVTVAGIKLVQGKFDTIFITRQSMHSGKNHTRCITGTTMEALVAFLRGTSQKLAQDQFPLVSADDREFIMTGITPEEWNEMFPPEKE